jgi:hypothetical protein
MILTYEFIIMLTQLFPSLDPVYITPDLSPRLRALADDCDLLVVHREVSPWLLQQAPLLEDWVPVITLGGIQLAGRVTGHPVLHGDRWVMTSPLWFADPNGTWVRTLSRYYRLGSAGDLDEIRRVRSRRAARRSNDGPEDAA